MSDENKKDTQVSQVEQQPVSIDDLISVIPLDNQTAKVTNELIEEQDLDKVKNLTKLFNLNQAKRNAIRVMKLNSLLDKVGDQMIERFDKKPGEFSNKELLDYMSVVQSTIDRANKSIELVDQTPAIVINQQNNQVNIDNSPVLDRESRMRVVEAVKGIMQTLNLKNEPEQMQEISEFEENEEDSDDDIVHVIEKNNQEIKE